MVTKPDGTQVPGLKILKEEIDVYISENYTDKKGRVDLESLSALKIISSSKSQDSNEIINEENAIRNLLSNINNAFFAGHFQGEVSSTLFGSGDRQYVLSNKMKADFTKISPEQVNSAFDIFKVQ